MPMAGHVNINVLTKMNPPAIILTEFANNYSEAKQGNITYCIILLGEELHGIRTWSMVSWAHKTLLTQ